MATLAMATKAGQEAVELRTQVKQRINEGIGCISSATKVGLGKKPAEEGVGEFIG